MLFNGSDRVSVDLAGGGEVNKNSEKVGRGEGGGEGEAGREAEGE